MRRVGVPIESAIHGSVYRQAISKSRSSRVFCAHPREYAHDGWRGKPAGRSPGDLNSNRTTLLSWKPSLMYSHAAPRASRYSHWGLAGTAVFDGTGARVKQRSAFNRAFDRLAFPFSTAPIWRGAAI